MGLKNEGIIEVFIVTEDKTDYGLNLCGCRLKNTSGWTPARNSGDERSCAVVFNTKEFSTKGKETVDFVYRSTDNYGADINNPNLIRELTHGTVAKDD